MEQALINQEKTKTNKRYVFADLLKIVASIAVVVIHVVSTQWYISDPGSHNWEILNVFDSSLKWCVPIFVMVTGMIFLKPEKKVTISMMFKKYILRMAIIYLFWSVTFTLLDRINYTEPLKFNDFISSVCAGHFHLWYIYMLISLYLITPIVKIIINGNDKKIIQYFLILWFIFEGVLSVLTQLPNWDNVKAIYSKLDLGFVTSYVGYYILGYYLNTYPLKKKGRVISYILGILSIILIIIWTKHLIIQDYALKELAYGYSSALVCLSAVAIFNLFKQVFSNKEYSEKKRNIITRLTKLSLGVYLIHPMFLVFMQKFKITLLCWPLQISVPIFTLAIYLLSLVLSYILSKIPIINKYIV